LVSPDVGMGVLAQFKHLFNRQNFSAMTIGPPSGPLSAILNASQNSDTSRTRENFRLNVCSVATACHPERSEGPGLRRLHHPGESA
jgi:hypothetical protein